MQHLARVRSPYCAWSGAAGRGPRLTQRMFIHHSSFTHVGTPLSPSMGCGMRAVQRAAAAGFDCQLSCIMQQPRGRGLRVVYDVRVHLVQQQLAVEALLPCLMLVPPTCASSLAAALKQQLKPSTVQ